MTYPTWANPDNSPTATKWGRGLSANIDIKDDGEVIWFLHPNGRKEKTAFLNAAGAEQWLRMNEHRLDAGQAAQDQGT